VRYEEDTMALKACAECGHPVDSNDAACPHCGAVATRRSKLFWASVAAVGLAATAIVFFAIFQPGSARRKAEERLPPIMLYQQKVDQLISDGVLTKLEGRVAWIEVAIWRLRSESERTAIATACGTLAGLKDHSNQSWCELRDNRTSKPIAKWSPATGLTASPQ
jgi:hypothetical protein